MSERCQKRCPLRDITDGCMYDIGRTANHLQFEIDYLTKNFPEEKTVFGCDFNKERDVFTEARAIIDAQNEIMDGCRGPHLSTRCVEEEETMKNLTKAVCLLAELITIKDVTKHSGL